MSWKIYEDGQNFTVGWHRGTLRFAPQTLLRVTKIALRLKQLTDEKTRIEKEKELYRFNLQTIFRSLSDAVISVDNQMTIIEANGKTALTR